MIDRKLNSKIRSFNENGFIVLKVFNNKIIEKYKNKIIQNLKKSANQKSISSLNSLKKLDNYFSSVTVDENEKLMDRKTRTIKIDDPDAKLIFNKHLSGLLSYFSDNEYKILRNVDKLSWRGKDIKNFAGFRIVKSHSKKVAGFHSDHYNLKDFRFTLWVPLVGFNEKYSLKVIPGSHIYKHRENVTKKNINGSARLLRSEYLNKLNKPYRPNLKSGEAILMHPYLIHGNSTNLGKKSRVSLEIRIGV